MKPLFVLLFSFILSLLTTKLVSGNFEITLSARIAMSVMLVFTAMAHFAFTNGMAMMLPDFIPFKIKIIYLTGIIEIAAAIGLFIPDFKTITALFLILFFIIILPANIYAAIKNVDYQKATFNGNGLRYLWFRIPLQILFIAWTYFLWIKS